LSIFLFHLFDYIIIQSLLSKKCSIKYLNYGFIINILKLINT